MADKTKAHGSMGKVPGRKGGGGGVGPSPDSTSKTHGSVGGKTSGNNKQLDMNAYAGGKGRGVNQKFNNPKPKCFAQGPQGKQAGGF